MRAGSVTPWRTTHRASSSVPKDSPLRSPPSRCTSTPTIHGGSSSCSFSRPTYRRSDTWQDRRVGAMAYDIAHTYVFPIVLVAAGIFADASIPIELGLIWFTHIGVDRAVGVRPEVSDGVQGHPPPARLASPRWSSQSSARSRASSSRAVARSSSRNTSTANATRCATPGPARRRSSARCSGSRSSAAS